MRRWKEGDLKPEGRREAVTPGVDRVLNTRGRGGRRKSEVCVHVLFIPARLHPMVSCAYLVFLRDEIARANAEFTE